MSHPSAGLRRKRLLAVAVLLGAAGCARPAAEAPRPMTTPAPIAAAGLRAYRDPTTGAFVEPPPGATLAAPSAAPAAPTVLTEEAGPRGGRMIRLKGAFRSQMVGRADASGATISCASTTSGGTASARP
jgi:hypothetical protein